MKDKHIQLEVLKRILESIDISDSAYEAAERRYRDLGDFLCNGADCAPHDPHVFPQGSFRLGTVVRPITGRDEFDLDLTCKLTSGVTRDSWSQHALKQRVGDDIKTYRKARRIQTPVDEKPRCWTLQYQDDPAFHIDIVPCIPFNAGSQPALRQRLIEFGVDEKLATSIAELSVSITDNRRPDFQHVSGDWLLSNPQGFALWFESRMRQAKDLLEERRIAFSAASINDLPTWFWKTPLQRAIQLLKRHRDIMFANNPEMKPISIIITTLSGWAYQGEENIASAVSGILDRMESYIRPEQPRVPNPTNPAEDFADKWGTPEGQNLNLQGNFSLWVQQAKQDFAQLGAVELESIRNTASEQFQVNLSADALRKIPGVKEETYTPPQVNIVKPARPWRQ